MSRLFWVCAIARNQIINRIRLEIIRSQLLSFVSAQLRLTSAFVGFCDFSLSFGCTMPIYLVKRRLIACCHSAQLRGTHFLEQARRSLPYPIASLDRKSTRLNSSH